MKSVSIRLDDELWEKLDLACSNKQEFLLTILKDALERDVIVIKGKIRYWGDPPEESYSPTPPQAHKPGDK